MPAEEGSSHSPRALLEEYGSETSRCPFMEGPSDVTSSSHEKGNQDSSKCPFSSDFIGDSFASYLSVFSKPQAHLDNLQTIHTTSVGGMKIESKEPLLPRLNSLMEGVNEPGDCGNPPEPPEWLDRNLFDGGCEFYRRYLACLSFADLLALVFTLSNNRALLPLIYTGQSDSPVKALKRYFSTLLHIITWYSGDVWEKDDDAHKDIMSIRSVHGKVANLCNSSQENEKVAKVAVIDKGYSEPQFPLYLAIQEDLSVQTEVKHSPSDPEVPVLYISQFDMSMTQYAFMGFLLAHPEKLGAGAATDEELEGLIHFWRGIGWLLGIKDKYNFCSGGLAETRALCLEVERVVILPSLAKSEWNYEHMATCLMSGIGMIIPNLSFPTMFRYLAYTINISVPSFVKRMSYRECFQYWVMRLTFRCFAIFPGLVKVFSNSFSNMINIVHGKSSKKKKCPKVKTALAKNYSL